MLERQEPTGDACRPPPPKCRPARRGSRHGVSEAGLYSRHYVTSRGGSADGTSYRQLMGLRGARRPAASRLLEAGRRALKVARRRTVRALSAASSPSKTPGSAKSSPRKGEATAQKSAQNGPSVGEQSDKAVMRHLGSVRRELKFARSEERCSEQDLAADGGTTERGESRDGDASSPPPPDLGTAEGRTERNGSGEWDSSAGGRGDVDAGAVLPREGGVGESGSPPDWCDALIEAVSDVSGDAEDRLPAPEDGEDGLLEPEDGEDGLLAPEDGEDSGEDAEPLDAAAEDALLADEASDESGDAYLLAQYVDVEEPSSSPEKPAPRAAAASRPNTAADPYAKTYSTGARRRRRLPRGGH